MVVIFPLKMLFEISGKVALVTGGASGLGLCYVKELLRHDAKGVTIADINADFGRKALEEIDNEFGQNRAIFVITDVSNKQNFEDAFKRTIEQFKNIDILINNAGIFNDAEYERAVAINFTGTLNGILLAFENYIQKYKTESEGVIVNISSVAGVSPLFCAPVYTATKFAVFGTSKAWGCDEHYQRTKIKVLCICPGLTETSIIIGAEDRFIGPAYKKMFRHALEIISHTCQRPDYVSKAVMELIKKAKNGTVWIIEAAQEPYEFVLPPKESFLVKK